MSWNPADVVTTMNPVFTLTRLARLVLVHQVSDLKATLVDGNYHDVDSSVLAFEIAAKAAFREGMNKGSPKLMEPMMLVDVITPEEHMGDVIGDLNSRRGMVGELGDKPGGMKTVKATVPMSIQTRICGERAAQKEEEKKA